MCGNMALLSALDSAMQHFFSVVSKPRFESQLQTVLGILRTIFASCLAVLSPSHFSCVSSEQQWRRRQYRSRDGVGYNAGARGEES